jgi:hypothetical protein
LAVEVFANIPTTTVSSGGTTAPASGTQETWTVASSTGFPAVSSSATPPTQLHIADVALNSEIISVINISGTTWTVIRGAESTTPVAHGAGFTIYQVVSAGGYAQLRSLDWLNVVTQFGADSTGSADCASAIQAAVSAMPASGGVIYFPAGTYRVNSTVTCTQPGVYFQGDTKHATIIKYYGSGDCIRMYSATLTTPDGVYGGGVKGLMIDGTNASAGAAGLHFGDIFRPEFDFAVRDFQGTGSKGAWFDNQYHWTEQITGQVFAEACTAHVVFDNSANTAGTATGSFDRAVLDIFLDAKGKGNGVVWQNGANCFDGRIGIYGNTSYGASLFYTLSLLDNPSLSFTATNASPCVFTAAGWYFGNGTPVILSGGSLPAGFTAGTQYFVVNVNVGAGTFQLSATSGGAAINSTSTGSGTVKSAGYAQVANSVLNIGVECNGTTGTQPGTINFANSAILSTCINQCTGIIDFSAASAFAANGTNWPDNFLYDGPVYGDGNLKSCSPLGRGAYAVGAIGNGGTIITRFNAVATVAPAGNVTGIIMSRDFTGNVRDLTVINQSAFTLTFAAAGTSFVADGTSDVIAALSAAKYAWFPNTSLWYRVGSQNFGGLFGDGSDGAATLDGSATVAWASKASSVYTMTRNACLTSLTVNNGVTLITAGCKILAAGAVANNGTISCDGNAAAGATAGAATTAFSLGGGLAGATGTTGAGAQGSSAGNNLAVATGISGAGGAGTAGAGGAQRAPRSSDTSVFRQAGVIAGAAVAFQGTVFVLGGSGGAASGAGDGASNTGGGGGGSAGVIAIAACSVVNTGTISAKGGNGGNGAGGNSGGGGGGGGGLILVCTLSAWTAGTTNVAGGTHGNGAGTGSNGSDGTAGTVLNVIVQ